MLIKCISVQLFLTQYQLVAFFFPINQHLYFITLKPVIYIQLNFMIGTLSQIQHEVIFVQEFH